MNKLLCFLLVISFTTLKSIYSQTVKINVNPSIAKLAVNSNIISPPGKLRAGDTETGAIAFLKGYGTQGIAAVDLEGSEYTIKLKKLIKPTVGFNSKKIEFAKIVDGTGILERPALNMGMYGTYQAVDLNDPRYSKAIIASLTDWGFKVTGVNAVFSGKSDVPDYALAGEVTWFTKNTAGAGFQVSLLVHWSLYSIADENVVYESTTGGFSDSRKDLSFIEELAMAFKDAVTGVMGDQKFQDLIIKKSDAAPGEKGESLSLAKPVVKKYATYGEMVKESLKSAVTVKTNFGHGSGFLISNNGYILTSYHVVNSAESIEVIFDNGLSLEAKVVRTAEAQDAALIKISGSGFKPLPVNGDDSLASVGTEVIAIGSPENIKLGQSVTKGILSGKRELDDKTYLQTDVAINPGNSGGPLINTATGEVIAIIAAKVRATGVEGLGFGTPIGESIQALGITFE